MGLHSVAAVRPPVVVLRMVAVGPLAVAAQRAGAAAHHPEGVVAVASLHSGSQHLAPDRSRPPRWTVRLGAPRNYEGKRGILFEALHSESCWR